TLSLRFLDTKLVQARLEPPEFALHVEKARVCTLAVSMMRILLHGGSGRGQFARIEVHRQPFQAMRRAFELCKISPPQRLASTIEKLGAVLQEEHHDF